MGNVRLSYTKNGSGAEVIEENNFYPFGLKHEGYNALIGNPSYNYQYNGKEYQKETGWSDYGARMYMADIGRWGVIDPLAETSRRFTPYNYALNNPVMFIDPDGRKAMAVDESWSWNVPTGGSGWFNERRNFGSFEEFVEMTSGFERERGSGGGNLEDTEATYNEVIDFLGIKQPEYFKNIDFSQYLDDNEEEPVNFFGKTGDDAPFYQKFKEMYNMFKDTKGDGVFRAFGHGGIGSIWDGEKELHNAKQFDEVMTKRNSRWANVDKMKNAILILYVCRSASIIDEYDPIGLEISRAHPNLLVIGFNGYVTYDNSVKGMQRVNKNQDSGDGLGSIVFYKNGKALSEQFYKDFRRKYKNFQ